jgi:hypothetical protein
MIKFSKKYYYINKFYSRILNCNYLLFISDNKYLSYYEKSILEIKSNNFKKLNLNKNLFLNKNLKVLYLNLINFKYKALSLKDIDYISFCGFFINNKYKNKISNYITFYKNNYYLFLFIIYININVIKYLLFSTIFKIIYILNKLKLKQIKN